MRGRRHTNLSTSSTSSSDSLFTATPITSLDEKRPISAIDIDVGSTKIRHATYSPERHVFYQVTSLLCIFGFILFHTWWPATGAQTVRLSSVTSMDGRSVTTPVNSAHPERLNLVSKSGQARWTVSIPAEAGLPLSTAEYSKICQPSQSFQSSQTLWGSVHSASSPRYMDIAAAQAVGVLAGPRLPHDTCHSSLTFVIDPTETSFGKTLLMLWLSYGIAKSERRAFFVDDSEWAYGKLSTFFSAMPKPDCKAPPPSHIVPCPVEAKHGLISSATFQWSLQPRLDALKSSWISTSKYDQRVFELIRIGYEALYTPVEDDKSYAADRVAQLKTEAASRQQRLVGMQIRRGDMHPFELEFSQDYLPLERYTDAAKHLLSASTSNSTPSVLLASDDPNLINTHELSLAISPVHVERGQDRIQLATKAALDHDSPSQPIREPGSPYVKHIDENAGWNGGFYSSLFASLGRSDSARRKRLPPQQPTAGAMRMRELVGRSYLLDLEVMHHAEGVVCAVSSAACRVLGVMMGWEAIQQGRWVNVDDGRPWSWNGAR